MELEPQTPAAPFFARLNSATADELIRIQHEVDPYLNNPFTQAERARFNDLMEYIAHKALRKIMTREDFDPQEKMTRSQRARVTQGHCAAAFNSAVKSAINALWKAREIKFSIRDVKTRANEIMAEGVKRADFDRAKLIRDTRNQLADELRQTRARLRSAKATASIYERRTAPYADLMETRKVLANQINRARGRLAMLQHACVQAETDVRVQNQGAFPPQVTSVVYPAPPPPHLAPTDFGHGLPDVSGIYFLWKDGVVEYVGKSEKLNQRVVLKSHHRLREHHTISFVLIDKQDLNWAECWYIGVLRPKLNFGKNAHHYSEEATN